MKAKPIIITSNRKELLQTNFNDLPIAFYVSNFEEELYDYIDWHWHDEVQYCLVIEGTVLFQVNKKEYVITAGNGIFINAHQVHASKPLHSNHALYYCLDFDPRLIYSDFKSIIYRSYVLPIVDHIKLSATSLSMEKQNQKEILQSIQKVKQILDDGTTAFELDIMVELLKLWKHTFLDAIPKKDTNVMIKQENERLREIFQFIQDHYKHEITLDMIAETIHLSRSECSRFFRKCTKQGLFHYITQYRIHKSLELLTNTQVSIAEVANAVGFTSQSYYTECFKKQMNMTPRQFRTQAYGEKKSSITLR